MKNANPTMRQMILTTAALAAAAALAPATATADSVTASNATAITISDGSGAAAPYTPGAGSLYPSPIGVSALAGPITDVNVTLKQVGHTRPDDLDVMLEGPGGQRVVLLSDAGEAVPLTTADLTFDDQAAAQAPDTTGMTAGAYKPTNHFGGLGEPVDLNDAFLPPAPGAPRSATLGGAFNNSNPNGAWKLYVVDDRPGETGALAGGWSLQLTTGATPAPPPPPDPETGVTAHFTVSPEKPCVNSLVTLDASGSQTTVPGGIIRYEWHFHERDFNPFVDTASVDKRPFPEAGRLTPTPPPPPIITDQPTIQTSFQPTVTYRSGRAVRRKIIEVTLDVYDAYGYRRASQVLVFPDREEPMPAAVREYCAAQQKPLQVRMGDPAPPITRHDDVVLTLSNPGPTGSFGTVAMSSATRRFVGRSALAARKTTLVAKGLFAIPAGESTEVKVPLTAAGKKLLRKQGSLKVRAEVVSKATGGEQRTATQALTLKRKGR